MHRELRVHQFDALVAAGHSQSAAASAVGEPLPTIRRWSRRYAAEGFAGLFDGCRGRSGRRREIVLNDDELKLARAAYVKTRSATTALRMLAYADVCREEVREFILRPRASKHNLPKTLRRQVTVPRAVLAYDQGPKAFANTFFSPRDLSYVAADGARRTLLPGDVFERDDMTVNFGWWVPWPWGGDKCSDRFGVRLLRGQLLAQIDVASLRFVSFELIARLRDSYRADDIWSWIGRAYRDIGLPRIAERLERGIWEGKTISGVPVEEGHTPLPVRLGGLSALGVKIIRSYRPTTKIIENRFNFLQTWMSTVPGQMGRRRGEMERETKVWTSCRNGHTDPRDYFPSMEDAARRIEAVMHAVNSEPVEGEVYRGVPDQLWADGVGAAPLKPLPAERAWLFARNRAVVTVRKHHARVRMTGPEGPASFWFFAPELVEWEGRQVGVYFDPVWPRQRAVITDATGAGGSTPNRVICEAALAERVPQFSCADGYDDEGGYERRRAYINAVRSEYRALGLHGKRFVKSAGVDDGCGNFSRVEIAASPVDPGDTTRGAADSLTRPRGPGAAAAPCIPFDRAAVEALIARREAEARERGELIGT